MKFVPLLRLALVQLCLVPNAFAQEEGHASHLSPDGRFVFEAFSSEEFDAEKRPDFGIIERATGKLVSDPREPLGNASRPEDGLAERWLDPNRIILTDVEECVVGEGDREEVANGSARAIVKRDEASDTYRIERPLSVAPPPVLEIGE